LQNDRNGHFRFSRLSLFGDAYKQSSAGAAMKAMSTVEFLSYLRGLSVNVSAEGDRLRISAPAGVVTPEIQKELFARKPEIVRFLKEAALASRLLPPPIVRASRDQNLPLSFAQMRLWLLNQLEPETAAYNLQSKFILRGELNFAAFERTLTEIVRRHEALRTHFETVDGQPVQKIAPPEPFHVSLLDLQALSDEEWIQEAGRVVAQDAKQPFDLRKAPLLRATLLKRTPHDHLLLFNVHHIVFDEWSLGVFQRELTELYATFLLNWQSSLPQLPIQYADYAVWQRNWLQGEMLQTQLDYWKENLKGSLPVLELPTDRPRPNIQTHNGTTASLLLSADLMEKLNALSRREGVTLFITLMSAFQVLLLRYTGQEDMLVGMPVANRSRSETEGLIGCFINTLVMRNDLSGNPSFLELMNRVQDTALGAYAHQDMPFEKLVQELNPERDLSRSPILQVLFSFLNTRTDPVTFPALEVTRIKAEGSEAKVDLSLYAIEVAEGISCTFEYNTDLFDADRIQRMLHHLEVLVENIVRDPGQRLSELEILKPAERQQLIVGCNQTQVDFQAPAALHELFEQQAQRTPDAVAVEFEGDRLSYRELNERTNQLARHLKSLGVGPETLVGLFHERSLNMMVALLGILKAGGAYVPLDPSFPDDRLSYMVENSGMRVLITQSSLDEVLPARPQSVVRMDTDCSQISRLDAGRMTDASVGPNHLAYVLYTSGSTGKPKGVEIEHSAIVNLLLSMQREPGFQSTDTLLAVTTLSFDIAGLELYLPLISGGRVVIASREDTHDPVRLMHRIEESRCTVMQATPTTWRALIHAGWKGSPTLKLLCGGEAFPPDLAESLKSRCVELWNMYGPTETTVWSTICKIDSVNGPVSIGKPIANTEVFVLDANRKLQPVGVPGELYIGGAGVARGYLNRAELTREKFVASPFQPNARLYRTGDLARWRPDGKLECLGRIDNQVKIRGFRIELDEVESVLSRHPGVRQCVVVASDEISGDKKLVAYYETLSNELIAISDLREHMKHSLPDYMIPTMWMALPELPLTPNGKVDRKALPRAEQLQITESRDHVAPRTGTENTLCGIWEEVLGVRNPGVHDDFFALGGHSLLAVNLINESERMFGIRFPLLTLFHSPTIAQFAEVVDREQALRENGRTHVDARAITQEVRGFIVENYMDGAGAELQDSDLLLDQGIIDPMRLYELIEFLEHTYAITIENDSLTTGNLDSIDNISNFILQRLSTNPNDATPGDDDQIVEVNS
jgi:amino acid adenylation domain-containing protein